MIVDYQESNDRPYQELLFIPGNVSYTGKKKKTISKIYVSTLESVYIGRRNWEIPKEQAAFNFEKIEKHITQIQVSSKRDDIFVITLKSGRLKFPVNTKFLPFPWFKNMKRKCFTLSFQNLEQGV